MKKYKSDNQIYRDMEAAMLGVLAEYIGDGAAQDTIFSNDEFSDRLYSLAEYGGSIIRYFELRAAADPTFSDDEIFDLFKKAEAER